MTLSVDAPRLALTVALGVCALFPAGYLLATALPVLQQGGWLAHFASTTLPWQAANSLQVALLAAAVAFAAGALPAVLVSRFDFAGRRLVSLLALLPLLFAPHVTASTWMVWSSSDFFTSQYALAMHLGLACAPYLFVVFRVAASRMPRAFAELAASFGMGWRQRLLRVHLPAYAVPVAAGLLIVFAQCLGDYAAAERLGVPTLSLGIHSLWFASQSSVVAAIGASVLVLPTLVLVGVAAWASTALISQNPVPPAAAAASLRALRGPAAWAVLGWSLLWAVPGFAIPQVITVRWAEKRWSRTRFEDIPGDMLGSLLTAMGSVLLVLAVCLLVAAVMRAGSRRSWADRWSERMPWLFLANYFLPTLVLALAFVMMSRDGSNLAHWLGAWRDTAVLVVLAVALRLMPFALLPLLDALRRTPAQLIEAALVHGAGPLKARALAFAGHLRPALFLGCALVFMEAVKEVDLNLTLQPFDHPSLALKIYAFSRHQNMDRAAVWVLLSQLLMLLPLALLWWRMDRLDGRRR